MSTVTILTTEGKEVSFPSEIDEEGRTWDWKVQALADGSLLLSLGRSTLRLPKKKPQETVRLRGPVRTVRITKEQVRFPQGSWIAQRWETGRYSKRDRLTNQRIM